MAWPCGPFGLNCGWFGPGDLAVDAYGDDFGIELVICSIEFNGPPGAPPLLFIKLGD